MSDHSRGKYRRRRQSPLVTALTIGVVVAAIIFLGCLYLAVSNQMRLRRMARDVAQLAATQTVALPTSQNNANTAPNQPAVSVETQVAATQPREILPQFQDLAAQNPDLAGWLTVGGTRIDYPVMYSPDEPERYLHANFEKQYSFAGLPFIDAAGQVDSGNRVIYAHNMLDGSMFRGLFRYEQKNYWEKHPTFTFSTLYEEKEYEIMSVFYDKVYRKTDTNFKFYRSMAACSVVCSVMSRRITGRNTPRSRSAPSMRKKSMKSCRYSTTKSTGRQTRISSFINFLTPRMRSTLPGPWSISRRNSSMTPA